MRLIIIAVVWTSLLIPAHAHETAQALKHNNAPLDKLYRNALDREYSFANNAVGDECDTTAQCKTIYGDRATDCRDSRSDQSVCYCGNVPCADDNAPPVNNDTFNLNRDLFLAFFDNRPDADDIHSQAGIATLLADGRFQNMDFYSVLGTYGKQGGAYLNSSSVMDLCFGSSAWTHAHPKDGSNWTASLNRVRARVLTALDRGGDVWVMEAGQSDFSADLFKQVKQARTSLDMTNRVHIVQHSDYNERQTTSADLTYVRANTDYRRIPDGNAFGNGSPQFLTRSGNNWSRAESLPKVGGCWAEARRVADANNFSGNGHYENPAIEAGGFDFSDVVEATSILGYNDLRNVDAFFAEFPKNVTVEQPQPVDPPVNNSVAPLVPVISLLLAEEQEEPTPASGAFIEEGGIVVIDFESLQRPLGWRLVNGNGAIGSYVEWTQNPLFNSPGTGVISAKVFISQPGTYQFSWRSSIRAGNSTTDDNDSWLKIEANNFYGVKDQSIVCPKGKAASNRCVGSDPQGSGANGWFKIYRSGGMVGDWKWQASTSDNDAHQIFADFDQIGNYTILVSARSANHGLDRMALYRARNASNNVNSATVFDTNRSQSPRQP